MCRNEGYDRILRLVKSRSFWYLGSILQDDGKLKEDVTNRIKVGQIKWKEASGFFVIIEYLLDWKASFYKTIVRRLEYNILKK